MSLIGRKKNIFTTISSIKSFNENDRKVRTNDSLSSLTNKKDPLSFLLDLTSVLIGSGGFIKLIGGLFGNVFDEAQPLIQTQISNNLTTPLSNKTLDTTPFNTGIVLPVSYIDVFNKLKTDPSTDIGNLIYGIDSFDYDLYDAINNPNTDKTIGNIIVNYNDVTDEFLIRAVNLNQIVFDFNEEYMDGVVVEKNDFITNVIDSIFGIKTSSQNKSLNQITKELILKSKIEKINNEEEISILPSELENIENNSKQLKNGVSEIDLGCGIYKSSITIDDLSSLINNIKSEDVDQNTISNEFSNLFDKSFNIENNPDAAKDNFSRKIINGFETELIKSFFLNPKTLILNYINQMIVDGEINNDTDNIIENNKKTISCISNKTKEVVNKFIFNLVKSELNNLIKPFVKMIIKEKINQYSGILRSLTGFS